MSFAIIKYVIAKMVSKFPFVIDVGFGALNLNSNVISLLEIVKSGRSPINTKCDMSSKHPPVFQSVVRFEVFASSEKEKETEAQGRP